MDGSEGGSRQHRTLRGSSAVPCRELCAVISRVPRQAFSSPRARLCLLQLRASRAVPRRRRLRRLAGRCALPWQVLLSNGVAADAVGPRRAGRAKRFDAFGGLPGAQAPSFFSNESHTTSHRHSCGRYLRVALTKFHSETARPARRPLASPLLGGKLRAGTSASRPGHRHGRDTLGTVDGFEFI